MKTSKKLLSKAYYWTTTYLPRKLPDTQLGWENLFYTLTTFYGVNDTPASHAIIAGHACSTPAHSIRRSYGYLANVAKRLLINQAARQVSEAAGVLLKKELEDLMAREIEKEKAKEVITEAQAELCQSLPSAIS